MLERHARQQSATSTATRAVKGWPGHLDDVLDEMEELQSVKKREALHSDRDDPGAVPSRDRSRPGRARAGCWPRCRTSIPEHQRILSLLKDREEKSKQIVRMEEKLAEFGIVRQSLVNSECVRIPDERGRADRADQAEPADADRARPVRRASAWGSGWSACSSTSTTRSRFRST